MVFTRPLWLLLAAALPFAGWLGWPRRAASRQRDGLALILRLTLLTAIILALSGFTISHRSQRLDVVFVLDWSDSLPAQAKSAALAFVQQSLAAMPPDDRAALIVFGQDALVERGLSGEKKLGNIASLPITTHTNLEKALRLALALLPPDNARRIVVLTDGEFTAGQPDDIAALIRSAGIDLRFVCYPFGQINDRRQCRAPAAEQPDAAILSAHLPDSVHSGEAFNLELRIQANTTISGTLEVRDNDGNLRYRQPYTARSGTHSLNISIPAPAEGGLYAYNAEFIPAQNDFYAQNNHQSAYTTVLGTPRLLVVAPPAGETLPFGGEPRPEEAAALIAAWQENGLLVERIQPAALPVSMSGLSGYAAIVLVDVPAEQFSQRQMQVLQDYVRNLGGGLIAIGGPTSFGVGGYYHTPLESALPVEMQIKDQQRRPQLSIIYIIDHSGSMMETGGGITKLNLAKEAAIRSIDLLMPGDMVGVIAFDDHASWAVPMQPLNTPDDVQSAIAHISGGGGTDIYAGLALMSQVLPQADTQVKHVILLTDGGADPTGIPEMIQRLYRQDGVTLTTIGVGRDSLPDLKTWAALGGGRYHLVLDPSTLPAIFTTETALVSRSYIEEGVFAPMRLADSPLLPAGSLPPLYGYVATEPKQHAQVILQSEKEDPLLVWWRYGLGKALAFTSDASGRWGRDWVAWDGYAFFWNQAARAVLSSLQAESLQTTIQTDGENAYLTVQASTPDGQSMNGYQMRATLLPPAGAGASQPYTVTLTQTALGRYEGVFKPTNSGVYLIHITASSPQGEGVSTNTAWPFAYPAEYLPQASGDSFTRLLAAISPEQTTALLLSTPEKVFTHDLPRPVSAPPWWQGLLAAAVVLLPLEVAVRRLAIGRQDVYLWRAALLKRARSRGEAEVLQESRVRTLFRVKRAPSGKPRPLKGSRNPARSSGEAAPPPPAPPPPGPAQPLDSPSVSGGRETAARLLQKKRARSKDS
ncbi:MAG: VWA domain-containing protein [Anaerolineales bacterium]